MVKRWYILYIDSTLDIWEKSAVNMFVKFIRTLKMTFTVFADNITIDVCIREDLWSSYYSLAEE